MSFLTWKMLEGSLSDSHATVRVLAALLQSGSTKASELQLCS